VTEAAAAARNAKNRADDIARHSRAARTAFAKQDLEGAIKAWDAVLEIEPDNRTALLEKQKVLGLKEKLGKVR
jgi:CBS-domain-containing membrane protein